MVPDVLLCSLTGLSNDAELNTSHSQQLQPAAVISAGRRVAAAANGAKHDTVSRAPGSTGAAQPGPSNGNTSRGSKRSLSQQQVDDEQQQNDDDGDDEDKENADGGGGERHGGSKKSKTDFGADVHRRRSLAGENLVIVCGMLPWVCLDLFMRISRRGLEVSVQQYHA